MYNTKQIYPKKYINAIFHEILPTINECNHHFQTPVSLFCDDELMYTAYHVRLGES